MSFILDWVTEWLKARVHSCYKLAVRLYTGRSEVERLALSPAPSSTSDSTEVDVRRKVELSRCLRRSSQLSPYLAPIYGTAAMPRSREPKVAPRAIATVEEVKEVSAKLVHTIVTAKRIKQRSSVEGVLRAAVRSIVDVNHLLYLVQAACQPYDAHNARHEQRLLRLWSVLRPGVRLSARHSRDWEELGFQGEDPATDFRSMGLLGLSNLLAFAEVCGLDASRLLQDSRAHGLRWYSFAITGINLTADLVRLTRERVLDDFYARYGVFFVRFNEAWTKANPASLMEFSTIHARFLDRVRFEAPHCWKAGYEFLEPLVAVDKFPAQLD